MNGKQSALDRFRDNIPNGLKNAATTLVPVIYFGAYAIHEKPEIFHSFTTNRDHMIELGEAIVCAAALVAGGYYLVKHIRSRAGRTPS